MNAFLAIVAVSAGVFFSTGVAQAQSNGDSSVAITQLMTAREVEATGLRTLTQDQLDALSSWLNHYRCAVERLALDSTSEDPMADRGVESHIDGDFDGWVGDTVFRLQNGQVWQQTSPSAKYVFEHAPKVIISPAPHTMRVEGIAAEIAVRRLR